MVMRMAIFMYTVHVCSYMNVSENETKSENFYLKNIGCICSTIVTVPADVPFDCKEK